MARTLSILALSLVAVPTVLMAQGTTSSALTGVVRDPSGQALGGALVRITSGAMIGGERTTRTSPNGSYRFPMLAPGLYKITVETAGYPTLSGLEILELGNTSTVNWKFQPAAAATVEVIGDATAMAGTEAVGVSTSLSAEVLANVPTGRDLTQVAALTPGVNVTDTTSGAAVKAWGGDIYGNSYTIDGLNVGDSKSGEKWVYANPDWFSQVQVSGLGASAEFGGFSGAVINGVVKNGGNTLEGAVSVYYQKNSWAALRSNDRIAPADRALYDGEYRSISASVGGPILKDKLWYFVSAESNTDSAQDSPVGVDFPVKLTNPRFLGKITWQALPSATWDAFLEYDSVDRENRYADRFYAKNATQMQDSPSTLFTTSWTQAFGQSVMTLRYAGLSARDDRSSYNPGGYSLEINSTDSIYDDVLFPTKPRGVPGLGAGVVTAEGLSEIAYPELIGKRYWGNVRRSNLLRENGRSRHTLSGTFDLFGTGILSAADSHAVRMGFEVEKSTNEEKRWIAGPTGTAYRARVRTSDDVNFYLRPYRAITGAGRDVNTDMERVSLFVQDNWTVNSRLQVRPGLRYEINKGGAKGGEKIWSTSTLAPRLGFTFNVTEDQSQVAKLHLGRYYTAMSSDYFQRAIPGVYQNTNVFYWGGSSDIVSPYNPTLIPVDTTVGGGDYYYAYNFNVSTLDPNHKQPYTDEVLFSYDFKLGREWNLGLTAVYRAKKDILVQNDPSWSNPAYIVDTMDVASPLTGQTYRTYITSRILGDPNPASLGGGNHKFLLTNAADAKNYYRMLTISAERPMLNHWSFSASFTWSKAEGNYSDSAAQSLNNFNDPNAQINSYGRLPYVNDREARVRGVYEFPWAWKTRLSATFTYLSGERYTPTIDMGANVFELNQNALYINAAPLGSAAYPSRRLLDLRISQDLYLSKRVKAEFFLDVFNLLNDGKAYEYGDEGRAAFEADFGSTPGVADVYALDSYQNPVYTDDPRRVRLGFKLKF